LVHGKPSVTADEALRSIIGAKWLGCHAPRLLNVTQWADRCAHETNDRVVAAAR